MEAQRASRLENVLMYRQGGVSNADSPRTDAPVLRALLHFIRKCRSLPPAIHLYYFFKQLI